MFYWLGRFGESANSSCVVAIAEDGMAVFRVGQRVRIIYRGKMYMREGTVTKVAHANFIQGGSGTGYFVDVDGYGSVDHDNGLLIGYEAHELEPLYDGHQTVSWESCLWKPNEENVSSATHS